MIITIFYLILAILGLSFLIFIHELGHYWVARRVGMRVEAFSIGFGRPIYSWEWDGVTWKLGWLLVGGYVKIAGQEGDEGVDPYMVKDGFFGKSPLKRIMVAFAGPLMNIIFAILAFTLLWGIGGREKNFSEYTAKIGWVDAESPLYERGVRPGDEITQYDGRPFQNFKDHIYATLLGSDEVHVQGNKVNYATGTKTPFDYVIKAYPHPLTLDGGLMTTGITQSASYIMYDKLPGGNDNPLPEGSPLQDSGIMLGDRIIWADGEVIFSLQQLNHVLNDDRALLTVKRGDKIFLARVPRVQTKELRWDKEFREELHDWQYAAGLENTRFRELITIPYDLDDQLVVEDVETFIDQDNKAEAFPKTPFSAMEEPLQVGDKILAIHGKPLSKAYELLKELQEPHATLIVERDSANHDRVAWKDADAVFDEQMNWENLQRMASSIGTDNPIRQLGDLYLLKTVTPKRRGDFKLSEEQQALLTTEILEQRKEIEALDDPDKRARLLNRLETQEKQLLIGLPGVQDRKVNFNPGPIELFGSIMSEIGRTLQGIATGLWRVQYMSGPVGIVHMMQQHAMGSFKEAIFWLGFISLNLGVINLLPFPVLDGGTIVFSFYEMISGRRMNQKMMETLVFVFAMLLITLFVFLTWKDIDRIFGSFF